jgi:hypothetical protein
MLDLVFTNANEILWGGVSVCPELKFEKMDHFPVLMNLALGNAQAKQRAPKFDFNKANFDLYRSHLADIPWLDVLSNLNVSDMWAQISQSIMISAKTSIPMKTNNNKKTPMWMNKQLIRKINPKKRTHFEEVWR